LKTSVKRKDSIILELKKLELYGFKSFADRTEIAFDHGITGVVGPNGSGKSNISDAVRWVLGEQNARQIRGAKMEDVIFGGTQKRKPHAFCEVSLYLDNQDQTLPIDFSEVVITRRLYRSGESEYFINRNSCRMRNIVDLFRDTGAGKEGYSIIGQGRVDELLSNRPEDRRAVFEEASGVSKYKARREEARRKLEHTRVNLTRLEDIIAELDVQIEPLEEQSRTAKEFLLLRDQLRNDEINMFIHHYERAQGRTQELENSLSQLEAETLQIQEEEQKIRLENVELDGAMQVLEEELSDLRRQHMQAASAAERGAAAVSALEESIARSGEDLQKGEADIDRESRQLEEIVRQMDDMASSALTSKEVVERQKEELSLLEERSKAAEMALFGSETALENAKNAMMEQLNRMSDIRARKEQLSTMQKSIAERIGETGEAARRAKEQVELALKERDEAKSALEEATGHRDALTGRRRALLEQTEEKTAGRRQLSETLQKLENEAGRMESRLRMLKDMKRDYEGFQHSVRSLLKDAERNQAVKSAILGVFAELITVSENVEKAIEVALGAAMQNIVTQDEKDAKRLIEHLRNNRYGKATFLPLSSVQPRSLSAQEKRSLSADGVLGVASELVSFDHAYRPAVEHLLGRVVIVRDMDTGIALARANRYAFRIVTQQGDVLNAGGSMTGGSGQSRSTSLLARDRQIAQAEKELAAFERQRAEAAQMNEKMRREIENLRRQAAGLENEAHQADLLVARETERFEILGETLADRQARHQRRLDEEAQLQESLADVQGELAQMDATASHESERVVTDEDLAALSSKVQQDRAACEALREELSALRVHIATTQSQMQSQENQREIFIREKQRLSQNIEKWQRQQDRLREDMSGAQLRLDALMRELEQSRAQQSGIESRLKEAERRREALRSQSREYIQGIEQAAQRLADVSERKHKMEMQKIRLQADLENLQSRMWDDYQLTYAGALPLKTEGFIIAGAPTRIHQTREKIRALGDVNVNAVEEYKRVLERSEYLTAQQKDLLDAIDNLNEVIDQLQQKMTERFSQQFELININFTRIFQQLFQGGTARLILQDPDNPLECGIDIVAQPPGKKLQSMSLLSGGEKTLTAIAILFAMLSIKPTPFCILDEIEANLDDVNAVTYAEFLRKYAQKTQFVVITHRKQSMEAADALYGVAMEEKGVSRLVSVRLQDYHQADAS
jgi:chromosome segregation protein